MPVKPKLNSTPPLSHVRARSAEDALELQGTRILLVDDDADTREMLTVFLSQKGATVEALSSARDALARIEKCHPDILLSDLEMPDMDGYEFIAQVRALGANKEADIPAIAVTGSSQPEDRRKALLSGFCIQICKPVDFGALLSAIVTLLQQ